MHQQIDSKLVCEVLAGGNASVQEQQLVWAHGQVKAARGARQGLARGLPDADGRHPQEVRRQDGMSLQQQSQDIRKDGTLGGCALKV